MKRIALLVGLLIAATAIGDQKSNSVFSSVNPPVIGTGTPNIIHSTNLTSQPTAAATTDAGNVGYVAMQSAIPFILWSGCTTTAGGAISVCPTVPNSTNAVTYAHALVWFPASVVNTNAGQIGNAAGWYWVVMSSSTAGQICTEGADAGGTHAGYVSGSPVAPGTCTHPTAATNCANAAACLNGNAQVVGPTINIGAHALGVNGRLEFDITSTTDGGAIVKSIKARYANAQVGATAVPTTALTAYLNVNMQNAGSEAAQTTRSLFPASATLQTLQLLSNLAKTTDDSTTLQPADVTMTVASTGSDVVLETYSIKVYPN